MAGVELELHQDQNLGLLSGKAALALEQGSLLASFVHALANDSACASGECRQQLTEQRWLCAHDWPTWYASKVRSTQLANGFDSGCSGP